MLVQIDNPDPQLVLSGLFLAGPVWSQNGDELAVLSERKVGGSLIKRIEVIDAETGEIRQSLQPEDFELQTSLSWSPTGHLFAASALGPRGEGVYLISSRGEPTLLTKCGDSTCLDSNPTWSPDGRQILFTRGDCTEPGSDCFSGDVRRIPLRGGPSRAVTAGPSLDCCAAWQPARASAD